MRDKNNLIDEYLLQLHGPLEAPWKKVEEALINDDLLGINIGVTEGLILSFLVKALNVKSVLEIGTQYGYSTLWFLKNLPVDGQLISIEKNEIHYQKATEHIQDHRCTLLKGDAQTLLQTELKEHSFDLIFIDANKKAYPQYLKYAKEHVVEGGLIVGDNTFLMNTVFQSSDPRGVDPKLIDAMREFNRDLFSDRRFVSCIFPTSEGMSIGFKLKLGQSR